jgi:uncharacterized protein YnzC (UPF0291/DUF896 family)
VLTKEKINRINELARKSKSVGLTAEEEQEQQGLRQEYLQSVRASLKQNLLHVKVVDPTGNDVTPKKLKREQNRNKKH